jgi:hypothetical protein
MHADDHLPHPTIVPAQDGWLVYYVSDEDGPADFEDFHARQPDVVIAFHCTTDGWTRPIVAGEQFAFRQEYILRDPEGRFVTENCGTFGSLLDAYRQLRPEEATP